MLAVNQQGIRVFWHICSYCARRCEVCHRQGLLAIMWFWYQKIIGLNFSWQNVNFNWKNVPWRAIFWPAWPGKTLFINTSLYAPQKSFTPLLHHFTPRVPHHLKTPHWPLQTPILHSSYTLLHPQAPHHKTKTPPKTSFYASSGG